MSVHIHRWNIVWLQNDSKNTVLPTFYDNIQKQLDELVTKNSLWKGSKWVNFDLKKNNQIVKLLKILEDTHKIAVIDIHKKNCVAFSLV